MQGGRAAALLLGELFICPWVPKQLKAVKKNGAQSFVVDAKAQPRALLLDSVLSRQLGPRAGRAVGPPTRAAAVRAARPPVFGQVGACNQSSGCHAACAAGTAKCTVGEHIVRSRLHAVWAGRQACLSELMRALGVDEAQRVRAIQRGCVDDTEGATSACGAGAGRGGARAAPRYRAGVCEEGGEHAALHEAVADQVDGAGAPRLARRGEAVRHGRRRSRRQRRLWQRRRRRRWRRQRWRWRGAVQVVGLVLRKTVVVIAAAVVKRVHRTSRAVSRKEAAALSGSAHGAARVQIPRHFVF